jgi:hypothetical protein|tara:strand:- start:626 stop:901 length:276 start_codon:yes stop_codon:yes gene_type:complete
MGCNCKETITNFQGGDVPNPTTFLDCGEADGAHKNPVAQGKVQCIAVDNVLTVHNTWEINGTVKNSGTIYFTREFTYDPGGGLQPIILMEI